MRLHDFSLGKCVEDWDRRHQPHADERDAGLVVLERRPNRRVPEAIGDLQLEPGLGFGDDGTACQQIGPAFQSRLGKGVHVGRWDGKFEVAGHDEGVVDDAQLPAQVGAGDSQGRQPLSAGRSGGGQLGAGYYEIGGAQSSLLDELANLIDHLLVEANRLLDDFELLLAVDPELFEITAMATPISWAAISHSVRLTVADAAARRSHSDRELRGRAASLPR